MALRAGWCSPDLAAAPAWRQVPSAKCQVPGAKCQAPSAKPPTPAGAAGEPERPLRVLVAHRIRAEYEAVAAEMSKLGVLCSVRRGEFWVQLLLA